MNCEYCGKEEALPFVCNYCGGAFCPDHRLPEAHQCKGDLTQKRTIIAPPQTTFTWSDNPAVQQQVPTRFTGKVFSEIEIRDIAVAWFGLGFAFFVAIAGLERVTGAVGTATCGNTVLSIDCLPLSQIFLISLLTVGSGFVLHELSHKFTAQRYGFWAEFRMWPLGLVLALATAIIGLIFAAPGATYISGTDISTSENGKISIAGPLTNVIVAGIFLPILFFGPGLFWGFLGLYGVEINLWLALFNLLPIMPLDGAKVWRWSKPIWLVTVVGIASAFIYLFLI
jgi:Zn-dependent protease